MIHCPIGDSGQTKITNEVRLEGGQIADRNELSAAMKDRTHVVSSGSHRRRIRMVVRRISLQPPTAHQSRPTACCRVRRLRRPFAVMHREAAPRVWPDPTGVRQ